MLSKEKFLYMLVYKEIKEKIEDGYYKEGTKLPSDDELKDAHGVSLITLKKALGMLKEEGYLKRIPGVGTYVKSCDRPVNSVNRTFTHGEPKRIGLVLEHVSSSFGLDLLYKLDCLAEEHGYKLLTRFSYYNREKETDEIEYLIAAGIDGLIVMPCHGEYYNTAILKLIIDGFPVVVIDKKLEGISVSSVRTDNRQAVKKLVQHLWKSGCRKLGFISSEIIGTSSLQDRRNGFYEAAGELSVEHISECTINFDVNIYEHTPSEDNIELVVRYLRANAGDIDGIICAEYSLLPAVSEALRRVSFLMENEIKLCCVDGPEGLKVTHMKQDEFEIANKVTELLFDKIQGEETENEYMIPAVFYPCD